MEDLPSSMRRYAEQLRYYAEKYGTYNPYAQQQQNILATPEPTEPKKPNKLLLLLEDV